MVNYPDWKGVDNDILKHISTPYSSLVIYSSQSKTLEDQVFGVLKNYISVAEKIFKQYNDSLLKIKSLKGDYEENWDIHSDKEKDLNKFVLKNIISRSNIAEDISISDEKFDTIMNDNYTNHDKKYKQFYNLEDTLFMKFDPHILISRYMIPIYMNLIDFSKMVKLHEEEIPGMIYDKNFKPLIEEWQDIYNGIMKSISKNEYLANHVPPKLLKNMVLHRREIANLENKIEKGEWL